MKTITPPRSTPRPPGPPPVDWTAPSGFTPFSVTCPNSDCAAVLLVDRPEDIAYRPDVVLYAQHVDYLLCVTCPHCWQGATLERYPQPGNPVGQPKGDAPPHPSYFCIPDVLRSRAYKTWEAAQSGPFWEMFFHLRAVLDWAQAHPRQSRKMRARLMPLK